jgi:DHA1 family bicyclomycin/chloramphenicol resistance-like MFS transporter
MNPDRTVPGTHALAPAPLDRDAGWFRVFLFGIAAVGPFSLNSFKPCLPFIQADLGAPMETVQLSLSLSILGSAVATLLAGPLTDRYGRRPVLLASLLLHVGGCVVGATAFDVGVLVAGRVVLASASSVALITARALIYDVFGEAESTRVIARVTMQTVLLVILAPMMGGLLIDSLGWRAVFQVTALFGAALLLLSYARLPETAAGTPADARRPRVAPTEFHTLMRSPVFVGYAMQSSLHFAAFFSFASAAAYLMVNVLHRPASDFGMWLIVPAVTVGVGLQAAERLSTRIPSGRLACAGSVLVLSGSALFAALLAVRPLSPGVLFLPAALGAVGIGLALPATNAGVMAVVPELAGTASGLLGFLQYVTAAVIAQLVVQDEPRTAEVLAFLGVAGGVAGVCFSLLSVRDRGALRAASGAERSGTRVA